jgi:sulfate adenylyltransferase large subunit
MSDREHLKFVVVGSVDHGKSTLIGRFLYDTGSLPEAQMEIVRQVSAGQGRDVEFAYVLDHLAEERAKHITIDTAQTFFSSDRRDYVIIDAPGHKEFLKNMITGASQASAALLLLDVHEGLREQTRRHAYMLALLGIRQLIVVLNKMDLAAYSRDVFDAKAGEMHDLLHKVTLDHLAVIPAAAKGGDNIVTRSGNMPWYDGPTVIEALDLLAATVADESLPLRLPIQDVYELDGKSVAVGRIASGHVSAGQDVAVCPFGQAARIVELLKFEGPIGGAVAGESIGLTVANGTKLARGAIIADPSRLPDEGESLTASVFWMCPKALAAGEKLMLRLATQELPCTVERIANRMDSGNLEVISAEADELADTEVAEVTLKTASPVSFESFAAVPEMGRLVLMRGNDIVAGGIVA